jgi:hypothetical protein
MKKMAFAKREKYFLTIFFLQFSCYFSPKATPLPFAEKLLL